MNWNEKKKWINCENDTKQKWKKERERKNDINAEENWSKWIEKLLELKKKKTTNASKIPWREDSGADRESRAAKMFCVQQISRCCFIFINYYLHAKRNYYILFKF